MAAVRRLIQKDGTGGFTYLKERGLLDLTVEALVAGREYHNLFNETDRAMARRKLR